MPHLLQFYKNFLLQNKRLFVRFLQLLALSIVVGVIVSEAYPDLARKIIEDFKNLIGPKPSFDFSFAFYIFAHNLRSELFVLLGGFIFGLGPILVLFFTGFAVGILGD